jgi:PmbA protein
MIEKLPDDKSARQWIEGFVSAGARDLDQAEAMVEAALLAGAEEAEVYLKTSVTSGILLQDGFATLAGGNERGIALRVFDRTGRCGHACASWGDPDLQRRLVRNAMAVLVASTEPARPDAPAPRPAAPYPEIAGLVDSRVFHATPQAKRSVLEEALRKAAGGRLPALAASWRDGISRVALVNSRGLRAAFHRTLALLTLTRSETRGPTLVAERVGCGIGAGEVCDTAEEILRLEVSEDIDSIAPRSVLLRSSATPALMRRLERSLHPDPDAGEESAAAGTRLAAPVMDLVDDPLLPGGIASSPFDGEGLPTRRATVLKSGILLQSPLAPGGAAAARGHAVRPSYRDIPVQGWTNLLLIPGSRSWKTILQGVESGILLAALEAESNAGRPDRAVLWCGIGWEVRGGEAVGPCKRHLFRAEAAKLLQGVSEISSESRFTLHRSVALGCPDLLIQIGG